MIKPLYFDKKSTPLKFYRFLVYFSLPLGCVTNLLGLANAWAADVRSWPDILFGIYVFVLNGTSLNSLKKWEWFGVRCFLFMHGGSVAYRLVFFAYFASVGYAYDCMDLLIYACGHFVYAVLSFIYFSKRKPLFTGSQSDPVSSRIDSAPANSAFVPNDIADELSDMTSEELVLVKSRIQKIKESR